jgi:hypothetical protein
MSANHQEAHQMHQNQREVALTILAILILGLQPIQ